MKKILKGFLFLLGITGVFVCGFGTSEVMRQQNDALCNYYAMHSKTMCLSSNSYQNELGNCRVELYNLTTLGERFDYYTAHGFGQRVENTTFALDFLCDDINTPLFGG